MQVKSKLKAKGQKKKQTKESKMKDYQTKQYTIPSKSTI